MPFTLLVLGLLGFAGQEPALSLFDGRSLEGWVAEGASDYRVDGERRPVWSAEDGLLVCRGKGFGFLRYQDREFADFVFHVEFRMAPGCNSGVGFRTRPFDPAASGPTRPSNYSYEIQLIDDAGKPATTHSTGSLYRYIAPKENAIKPAGEWNTLEVTCEGPRVRVVLNGKLIQDVDQSQVEPLRDKPLRGYVCLQNHGGNIAFRAIEVRELKGVSKSE